MPSTPDRSLVDTVRHSVSVRRVASMPLLSQRYRVLRRFSRTEKPDGGHTSPPESPVGGHAGSFGAIPCQKPNPGPFLDDTLGAAPGLPIEQVKSSRTEPIQQHEALYVGTHW